MFPVKEKMCLCLSAMMVMVRHMSSMPCCCMMIVMELDMVVRTHVNANIKKIGNIQNPAIRKEAPTKGASRFVIYKSKSCPPLLIH